MLATQTCGLPFSRNPSRNLNCTSCTQIRMAIPNKPTSSTQATVRSSRWDLLFRRSSDSKEEARSFGWAAMESSLRVREDTKEQEESLLSTAAPILRPGPKNKQ